MAMARDTGRVRRAGAVAALAVVAGLTWPGTAYAADVTVTPTQARQGTAVRLEFVVPEERAGIRTDRIEIRPPRDAPIAEVYPMSVAGWAPRITSRTLDEPVAGIHSAGVSTVTGAVTWTRMPESGAGPARLALSMGPLPRVDRLTFEVLQTYADGTVVRWTGPAGTHAAPTLALLPAAPDAAAGHGHGAAPGADGPGAGGRAPAGDADDGGNADALLAAGLIAGLGGGAVGGWLLSRWRRRDEPGERVDLRAVLDAGAPASGTAARTGGAGPGEAEADRGEPARTG